MVFFIFGIIVPIIFIIYNLFCYYNEKIIYAINSKELKVINKKFFKLQLGMSIINSILISVFSYVAENINYTIGYLFFISTFWGINYSIKYIAVVKQYIAKDSK